MKPARFFCLGTVLRFLGVTLLVGLSISDGLLRAAEGDVHVRFDLSNPAVGPFPSDQFTVADSSQITGRRVAMPKPDCAKQPTDCDDLSIINALDGFNLQPRIVIAFDGAINPNTVSSKNVSLVEFGGAAAPRVIGINQIVWDTLTHTLFVTSDESLPQHSQFALIATKGILDGRGNPVQASDAFTQYLASGSGDYRDRLRAGIDAAAAAGIGRDTIVAASVFTTLSATATLEKIRDQIHAGAPKPASFVINGVRTVFARSAVSSIVIHRQTRVTPPTFSDGVNNLVGLELAPGTVGTLAFGTFESPNYETPKLFIPPVGTLTGTPAVQSTNTLSVTVILPSGPKPANGWPTAIMGHYNAGSKEDIFLFASILAKHGLATIAINGPGHGYGPLGTLDIQLASGEMVTIPAGGRGVDIDGNNTIGANEGLLAFGPPYSLVVNRDGILQTIADLMQLVRVMQTGIDVDGDGKAELDASRITYLGSSLGGNYGIPFQAVEPAIRAGAVAFAGGSRAETWRLGAFRGQHSAALSSRIPSLTNSPGVTQIRGLTVPAPYFNENKPLRNLPPVINDVPGAIEIQRVLDYQSWAAQSADPVAFAPYVRKRQLAGMTARPILILMAKGDQPVPVPVQTALVRSGELADITTYFRFDTVYAQDPKFPSTNPHIINTGIAAGNGPLIVGIATGMQEQVATFLETEGAKIIHPTPTEFYEVPIKLPLPENLEYVNSGKALAPVDSAVYETSLSPGSLFTIFGPTYLIGGEDGVAVGNLPTTLSGVTVSINGRATPLSYVGRNQINGQVPYEATVGDGVVQVIAGGISGAAVPMKVSPIAPKLFVGQGSLCLAQNEDGTLNSGTNPAKAGRYLGAYLIGIGPVNPVVASGAPSRSVPLSGATSPVSSSLGGRGIAPSYLGMIPGMVGVAEVDLLVPADMAPGAQNFSVTIGSANSNTCQIVIGK